MAGEDTQQKPAENRSSGGGGSASKSIRPQRKRFYDRTNIGGFVVWLVSTLLTSIALMLIFLKLPPECVGVRGQILNMSCAVRIISSQEGMAILISSVVAQFLISIMVWRLRHTTIKNIGNTVERVINFIGFYWLLCVQINVPSAEGVYNGVSTFIKNMSVATFLWYAIIISLSVGWPILEYYLFSSPPSTPAGGGGSSQRR